MRQWSRTLGVAELTPHLVDGGLAVVGDEEVELATGVVGVPRRHAKPPTAAGRIWRGCRMRVGCGDWFGFSPAKLPDFCGGCLLSKRQTCAVDMSARWLGST